MQAEPPWMPNQQEMREFNEALDCSLVAEHPQAKTPLDDERTRRLYRAVMYRIPFEPLTNRLWYYTEAHQTTALGSLCGALGDRLTWVGMWLNRNGLTRKRP